MNISNRIPNFKDCTAIFSGSFINYLTQVSSLLSSTTHLCNFQEQSCTPNPQGGRSNSRTSFRARMLYPRGTLRPDQNGVVDGTYWASPAREWWLWRRRRRPAGLRAKPAWPPGLDWTPTESAHPQPASADQPPGQGGAVLGNTTTSRQRRQEHVSRHVRSATESRLRRARHTSHRRVTNATLQSCMTEIPPHRLVAAFT